MQYYIKEKNRKQILEFTKSVKGMHSKDEKRLRTFIEADSTKWLPMETFAKNL